ncbi:MAG: hypothetical protein JNG86_01590, partial [Verrucomicrobiaceae bacterium]|nr:hypothetical protein [Verrucomicrobiaceae bacterium]
VTGDDPAANPPAGGTATSTGSVAANTMSGQNGGAGAATTAGTTGAVVAADLASKSADAPTRVVADNSSTSAPQAGSGAVADSKASPPTKSPQSATSVVADNASTSSPKAGSGGTVSSKPDPASNSLPEAITTGNAGRVASSNKADASTVPSTASSSAAPKDDMPEFVRPAAKRPGLIAQSRALVTERQFKRSRASEPEPKAEISTPKSSTPAPAPVVVPKVEAEDYARRTTATLRQQGTLKPTQSVRLPRQQETTNTRVWREEDTPATAEERRPFGLVVEDTNPAFTPEGIPLRTDIPAGVSPLEKTGADKPLWKKPE